MTRTEIRIAGLGGQGVVLAGQILGRAAAYDGKSVVQTQSYGAEARGSAAKSEIIISDTKIGFPLVRRCDILVALNQEAADKHIKDLKEDGTLLIDSSVAEEVPDTKARVLRIRATEAAEKALGAKVYTNIIVLGALIKLEEIVSEESMIKAIKEAVPSNMIEKNLDAFRKGQALELDSKS